MAHDIDRWCSGPRVAGTSGARRRPPHCHYVTRGCHLVFQASVFLTARIEGLMIVITPGPLQRRTVLTEMRVRVRSASRTRIYTREPNCSTISPVPRESTEVTVSVPILTRSITTESRLTRFRDPLPRYGSILEIRFAIGGSIVSLSLSLSRIRELVRGTSVSSKRRHR